MRKKIFGIFLSMLLISVFFSAATAGDKGDPEIVDDEGDAFGNIDIDSVWFWEDSENPDCLYVSMKINQPNIYKIQQTFAVFWEYEGVQYACGLFIGIYLLKLYGYSAGEYVNSAPAGGENYFDIETGEYDVDEGVITWEIPKEIIGDPQPGEVLTKTWSNAFHRYGILGLMGLSRPLIDLFFMRILGNSLWDYAPNDDYGSDYVIQY